MKSIKTYSELIRMSDFLDRYRYLRLGGRVGEETFGVERYLNQIFYKTKEWLNLRHHVIVRDQGRDLGVKGYEIHGRIIVHHMNPLTVDDIINRSEFLLNPEYLISTSHMTHQAITYGNERLLMTAPVERRKYDTCPWRQS